MNKKDYAEYLDDVLLKKVPQYGLHQWEGISALATLFAFLSKRRREKKETKKKLVIINQEAIKV